LGNPGTPDPGVSQRDGDSGANFEKGIEVNMATVVVGGHSRNVGKTSVVVGLIESLREMQWTAVKITQFGHGICSAHGEPCDCAINDEDHTWAVTQELSRSSGTDTSRFLAAGAIRSLWVRTRQGRLAEAMPRLRRELETDGNFIIESNSIVGFLRPNLYLTVLDHGTADFKESARTFLDRADAVLLHSESADLVPNWGAVSLKLIQGKPVFPVTPDAYVTGELVEFVRNSLMRQRALN